MDGYFERYSPEFRKYAAKSRWADHTAYAQALYLLVYYRKPRRARQVQNLPHTSESAADFPMTDEGGSPLERDVSPDKTDQNKPVPFWQVTLPRRARRIPGPGGTGVKFVASSARAGGHLMWPPCEPGL